MFAVPLVFIRVQLLAEQDEPVLLDDASLLLLLKDLSLDVYRVLALARLTRLLGRDAREPARAVLLLDLHCRDTFERRSHGSGRGRLLRGTDREFLEPVHGRLEDRRVVDVFEIGVS